VFGSPASPLFDVISRPYASFYPVFPGEERFYHVFSIEERPSHSGSKLSSLRWSYRTYINLCAFCIAI